MRTESSVAPLDWILIKFPANLNHCITGSLAQHLLSVSSARCCLPRLRQTGERGIGAGGLEGTPVGEEGPSPSRGPSLGKGRAIVKALGGEAQCLLF